MGANSSLHKKAGSKKAFNHQNISAVFDIQGRYVLILKEGFFKNLNINIKRGIF